MTQHVKIKTNDNKDLSLTLRDDGRIFFELIEDSFSTQVVPEEKKVPSIPLFIYISIGVLQVEMVLLALKVFGLL